MIKKIINCGLVVVLMSCVPSKKKEIKGQVSQDNSIYIPLPKTITSPKDNLSNPEKVILGKLLFYDPILSGNKDVACATCHHPNFGYAEGIDLSIGVNGKGLSRNREFIKPNDIPFAKRNAHTVLNTAFNGIGLDGEYNPKNAPMFWDAREKSLEEQAIGPIKSMEEMRGKLISEDEILDTVVNRLKNIPEYVSLFRKAFPNEKGITRVHLAKAIASFERTLVTNNSRFDQFVAGDEDALSFGEKQGFRLFKKAGCNNCHNGPMFSDYKMHVLGVPDNEKLTISDSGFEKRYAFRTPSLRNLRYTAPYMHTGKFKDLQKVLEFYEDVSSGVSQNPHVSNEELDTLTRKIKLKVRDMRPIISFFNSLNSTSFDKNIPKSVPSKLQVGGNID